MSREFIREDYLQLELEFKPVLPAREIAIAYLAELNFEVFEPTDLGLIAHTPNNSINRTDLDAVRQDLEAIAEDVNWSESIVQTENWNAKWEEEYEPVNVDDKVLVRAPFHNCPTSGLDIIVKPNMSFGTGHHDTTWMMIKALLELDLKGANVLDMGCGTGVLAIVAKQLGASNVLAIDIEEGAAINTRENAQLNSIALDSDFIVDCGTSELLTNKYSEGFSIVLANINRNVLIHDIDAYNSSLEPSGQIVFSGFFTGDVKVMRKEVEARGLTILKVLERNGWACIICGKPE